MDSKELYRFISALKLPMAHANLALNIVCEDIVAPMAYACWTKRIAICFWAKVAIDCEESLNHIQMNRLLHFRNKLVRNKCIDSWQSSILDKIIFRKLNNIL